MDSEAKELPIKKGDYIRRANYLAIGKKIAIEVQHVREIPTKDGMMYRVNGKGGATGFLENLVILSKEEAERLNKLYAECEISETLTPGDIASCIREDNGEPKQKHNERKVKPVLFRYRQLYPEKNFHAYKCSICGHYHLGKKPEEQVMEK